MTDKKRVDNWVSKLCDAVDAARGKEFQYGEHDCALFVADLIQVMTGEDLAAEFRGQYSDRKSALKALKKIGAGDLRETITAKLGDPIPLSLAMRGDVVLAKADGGEEVVAMIIDYQAVAAATGGYQRLSQKDWVTAWKV